MLIHLSVVLGMEALFLPVLVFGIYLLLEYRNFKGIKAAAVSLLIGITFGIVSVSRIILFPFIFIGIIWMFFRRKTSFAEYLGNVVLVLIAVIIINSPFVFKNYQTTGKFLISNLNKRGSQHYSIQNKKLISLGINPFKDPLGSFKVLKKRPIDSAKAICETTLPRIVKIGFSSYFGSFDPIFLLNPRAICNHFAQTMEFYVYIFLIAGVVWSLRFRFASSFLILSFILYTIFIYSFFYVLNARYRAPIQPFLHLYVIFGAFFLCNKNAIKDN